MTYQKVGLSMMMRLARVQLLNSRTNPTPHHHLPSNVEEVRFSIHTPSKEDRSTGMVEWHCKTQDMPELQVGSARIAPNSAIQIQERHEDNTVEPFP